MALQPNRGAEQRTWSCDPAENCPSGGEQQHSEPAEGGIGKIDDPRLNVRFGIIGVYRTMF